MKSSTLLNNYNILTIICCAALFTSTVGFSQTQTVIFSTTGASTWTAPCGVTSITVQAWGGGGAGGGSTSNYSKGGGGGAGGAYVSSNITVVPNTTYNLWVGKGADGDYGDGDQGKASWFSSTSILYAEGGKGGKAPNGGTVAGGIGSYSSSIGTIRIAGSNGANGTTSIGGAGGMGANSGGVGGGARTFGGDGNPGSQPGGGGGGAFVSDKNDRIGGDGGDGEIIITYNGIASYCIPSFRYTEPITYVNFAGINNTTTASTTDNDYWSYCITGNVTVGNTYPITLKGNTVGPYTDYFKVFIDWNQNGVLDVGEAYPLGSIFNSTGTDAVTLTGNIAVPLSAVLGTTRMRIIKNYNGYGNACDPYTWGQAEDYLLNVSANCTAPTGARANGTAGTLTVCTGTQVTLQQTGGALGTGQSWKWYAGGCGSGAALNTNTNADASYTFTPSVGTTTYYVRAEGGVCLIGACKSVTVIVKDNATISVTPGYSKDFSACQGVNNAAFAKFDLGGGATGATITGLPAGLTYNSTGTPVVISGTPTVAGSFSYTITPTGNAPCTNTGITGTITVSQAPTSVTYTSPVVYCSGAAITPNVPVIGTGTGIPTNYVIVGSPSTLPAGLSLDPSTGIISGTPTVISAATNYTIQASNACGSVNTTVNIAVSAGDQVFDITPSGTMDVCSSTFTGVNIGLSGSQPGVSYQLYLNGTPVGASVPGTGASISFGNQTAAGIYTVTTTSSCATNMNGSLTVNITLQPNVSFSYLSTQYCSQGLSDAPVLSGSPQTGTFSATPSGLVFSSTTTGVIDLAASTPGTYIIVYTVAASGGCSIYTSPGKSVTIGANPQVFNVYGGGGYCSGGAGVEVGLDNSETGINYQLYRDGTTLVNTLPGTGGVLSFGNQTSAGTYTIVALNPPCQLSMNGSAVVVVNPNPSPIVVAPANSTICQGSVQALTASVDPPTTSNGSVTLSSGTLNLSIPDNNATGVMNLIKLTGVPVGATITSVSIQFNITHSWDGDLLINLKGPNNNVLNIANGIGGSGNNFTNTVVASNASTNISFGSAPFSGTYLPQGTIGVIGANVVTSNVSTVANFSGLYGTSAFSANGNWTLSVRDKASGDVGKLNNWSITINYTYVSNIVNVAWSPATDLFSDQYATTAYTDGDELSTVYAKPSTYGSATYTATATNEFGCSVSSDATLTVNQSPQLSVAADYCSKSDSNMVVMTATSDIDVNIADWQWSDGLTLTSADNRTSVVRTKNAGTYYVTAKSVANGCTATTSMSIAEELVTNGDFEQGNVGFTSDYTYVSTPYDGSTTSGLWPEKTYTVDVNPQVYHPNFWGTDHTTANGTGKFMLVNGYGSVPVIWSETVTVLPNTNYYFSAYAVSLNNVPRFANLQFRVNGDVVGTSTGALPSKSSDNNSGTWYRFYSNPTWASGSATTAIIEIVDLEPALGGNDFGLDDISFGTLSTFLNLTSGPGSNNQTNLCYNTPINTISYEVGGDGTQPVIDNLPAGLKTYWNGRDLIITGTPTESGTFNYTVHGTGCNTRTAKGKIQVYAPAYAGDFASPVISACYGSNGSIDLSNTVGNILNWQSSTDGGTWTDVANTTTSLSYTNVTSPIYYRAVAQNGALCSNDTSLIVKLGIHNYWSGITSTSWDVANNWSDVQLPTTPCVVVIPAGTPYSPQLNTDVTVNDIIINNGAKLDLNNRTLTITGSYSGTGTLTGSESSGLVLTGNTGTLHFTPNVYPSNTTNNYLKTLTVNSAAASVATIGDSLNIAAGNITDGYGTVTVTDGTLNANGNLILKSDANGTSRIGYSTGDITGEAIVERFIPGLRAWRFMAVPFSSSSQTMRDAWQEGVNNYTLDYSQNLNPHPGFGTHITGDNVSTKGYDLNTTTNPSVKVWDPVANSWSLTEPQTISTNITDFNAYCLFVRGSRNVNLALANYAPTDDTRLRIKGVLNQTGLTAFKSYNGIPGGFVFVGNPYASSINIYRLIDNTTEIQPDKFWLWDPKISGGYNVGGYVAYSNGLIAPFPSPSYPTAYSALNIQSGQAFMVQLDNSSSTVTMKFKESDKVDTVAKVFGFTGKNAIDKSGPNYPVIYTNLMVPITEDNMFLADGVTAAFDNKYSAAVDENDAQKKWGFNDNMSLFRDSNYLAIELRPQVKLTDTLFYRLFLYKKPYVLKIFAQNASGMPLTRAWLVDRYLGTKTEVNLFDTTLYSFTPNNDLSSYRDRFMLVFNKQLGTIPVPVTKATNQEDPNTSGISASVDFSNGKISIMPNPVTTAKNAMLRFNNIPKGEYEIVVYDAKGQQLATKKILHNVNTATYNLPAGPSWASGVYIVNVVNENSKQSAKIKLVISR